MSGMKWILVALVGCGLVVFYVSRSQQELPPQVPEQTDIGQTAESQGQEITGQVIEHSVLRKWNPNNDFRGLGLEILVSEEATEDQLVELIKTLAAASDHVNIRVYSSEEAYREEQSQSYGEAYQRGYLLFYVKNLSGNGPFDGFNEIRWMQQAGNLPHKLGEKIEF